MRIEQLRYFLEITRCGSFNTAARKFFVSQQGISEAIKRMEQELGVVLFERKKTGASLTKDGADLIAYVQQVLDAYDQLMRVVDVKKAVVQEEPVAVPFLVTPMFVSTVMPSLIDELRLHYPWIKLQIKEMGISGIVNYLAEKSGIGLVLSLTDAYDSLEQRLNKHTVAWPLYDDELVACVSVASPVAQQKQIKLEEYSRMTSVGFAADDLFFESLGESKEQTYTSSNVSFHQQMVLENKAVSMVAKSLFPHIFPTEQVKKLSVIPSIRIRYVVLLNTQTVTEATKIVLQTLHQYIYGLTGHLPRALYMGKAAKARAQQAQMGNNQQP